MSAWSIIGPRDSTPWQGWLDNLVRNAAAESLTVVHRQRNLLLQVAGPDGELLVAKRWRSSGFSRLLRWGKASKAQLSYDAAQRLGSLGLPTPAPRLWASRPLSGGEQESWYCCQARLQAPTLYVWTHEAEDFALAAGRHWRQMLLRAGALVAKLHQHGVEHRDLTPGNIITSAVGQEVIDLNRIRFHQAPLSGAVAALNLAQIGCRDQQRELAVVIGYATAKGEAWQGWWQAYRTARRQLDRKWRIKDNTRNLRHGLRTRLRKC